MAVENKYTNTEIAANQLANAAKNKGSKTKTMFFNFEVAAADDNLSVYRIIKGISGDQIVKEFKIFNDAITSSTDWDAGVFESLEDGVGGDVVDKDIFMDGADLSAGNTRASFQDGLTTVAIEDLDKDITALLGLDFTTRKRLYDIALTANVVGSTAGTVCGYITFVQG